MKMNKNMRKILFVICTLAVVASCVQNRFERVEKTGMPRYDIVYSDNKCAVFDNQADSLVTPLEYDALNFIRQATEDTISIVMFTCHKEGMQGLLSIFESNNEKMEFLFPDEYFQEEE